MYQLSCGLGRGEKPAAPVTLIAVEQGGTMRIKAGTVLMMLILLSPLYGFCELEGHGVLDEEIHGIRLYQRPKVNIPAGWQEHEEAGQV